MNCRRLKIDRSGRGYRFRIDLPRWRDRSQMGMVPSACDLVHNPCDRAGTNCSNQLALRLSSPMEFFMKTTVSLLFAAAMMLSSVPAHAVVLDLSTLSCKQFLEGGDDEIKMVLTWMDGWYKGDQDEAIIDTDVFVDNAKKFGEFCAKNPTISIVNAAEKILGK